MSVDEMTNLVKRIDGVIFFVGLISAILFLIFAIYIVSNRYQSTATRTFSPAPDQEVFNVERAAVCGTLELSSGTTFDDCTETYEIASDSVFIVTDSDGNQRVARGPLKIEARQYIDFDKPTNLQDFVGNDYSFGYGVEGQGK